MGASAVEDAAAGRVSTVLASGSRFSASGLISDLRLRPLTQPLDVGPSASGFRLSGEGIDDGPWTSLPTNLSCPKQNR